MATNTYVALDKSTVATATSSITFTGISGAYTDLYIVGSVGVTAAADILMTYNGDSTSGLYSHQALGADGATVSAQRYSNRNNIQLDYPGYAQSTLGGTNFTISVQNYSNTTIFKTSLNRFNNGASGAGAGTNEMVGVWRNTNAISSITLTASGTTFLSGSTFSLYGIKAEGTGTSPKATGGVITSDATYYYHTFNYSGTFTPNQSLSCDILQIAGGGAGGRSYGGGGGAGALRFFSAQALTATSYSAVVGAGGVGVQGALDSAQGNSGSATQFAALTSSPGGGGGGTTQTNPNGLSGGCGGGAGYAGSGGAGSVGFAGGNTATAGYSGAGGGGMGAAGTSPVNSGGIIGGNGGNGLSTYSSWGAATNTGQNVSGTYWYAGGGGGAGQLAQGTGGNGGGGSYLLNGMAFTGGGGHGWGSSGGSGVIIVRYTKA